MKIKIDKLISRLTTSAPKSIKRLTRIPLEYKGGMTIIGNEIFIDKPNLDLRFVDGLKYKGKRLIID